jgi:hypothetical protein
MRARIRRGTAAEAAAATLYKQDLFLAEDTGVIYAYTDAGVTGIGDGAAVGPTGSTGATGSTGPTGPAGASFTGGATLTSLSLSTAGFTGCTGALALTGGATIQALFTALSQDIVVAATAA